MPDQLTLEQFGAEVKKKYPAYASKSDAEVGKAVLAKYPQYASRVKVSGGPEARTVGNYADEITRGVGRGLKNDVVGAAQAVMHPIDTATGLVKGTYNAGVEAGKEFKDTAGAPMSQRLAAATLTGLENAPMIGGMVLHAEEGGERMGSPEAAGAAAEGITTFAAPELAGRAVGPLTRGLKTTSESIRKGAQASVGAGERAVKHTVGQEAEAANVAREKTLASNKAADEGTLEDRGKVDQKNAQSASKDAQARKDAEADTLRDRGEVDRKNEEIERKNKQARQTADEKTLEARAKVDQRNAEIKEKNDAAKQEVIRKNREAEQAHAQEKAAVEEHNRAAMRDRAKRVYAQRGLEEASAEMRARIEGARENALDVGNKRYSAVNDKLSHMPADMETVHNLYQDASGEIGDVQAEPPILKRLGKSLEQGNPLTYKDLQATYSELGKELSKGTLPGPTYHAYDVLHEGIGKDMQRIADSQGAGAELTEARNYWRRMKQTFGKPLSGTNNATDALRTANPDFLKSDQYQNQLRLLGSFDPQIAKAAEHIGNLRQGLDALGEDKPLREVLKSYPERPEPIPAPKPQPLISYGEPEAANISERAQYGEPRPTPASTPPAEYGEPRATKPIERPEVNTRAIRKDLLDRWSRGEEGLNKWQVRALVAGPIGGLIGVILGHGGEGAGIGYGLGSAIGPAMIAKLVERPAVREWLTRPPAGELQTLKRLPNADRVKITDGLKQVATAAQKRGVKVSPLITNALGVAGLAGPKAQQLKKTSDGYRTQ